MASSSLGPGPTRCYPSPARRLGAETEPSNGLGCTKDGQRGKDADGFEKALHSLLGGHFTKDLSNATIY
jgi:hypothetical protein